mmetsp:Transcript_25858/g.65453  ORF Transcript_25858/g.65453 Transcript_25858/m.65453 type:complete len:117 (-) Transcript_25858:197-547(-)
MSILSCLRTAVALRSLQPAGQCQQVRVAKKHSIFPYRISNARSHVFFTILRNSVSPIRRTSAPMHPSPRSSCNNGLAAHTSANTCSVLVDNAYSATTQVHISAPTHLTPHTTIFSP